jgi:ribosomal protein L7Ae-like RNA K-turn-binding protein
LRAIESLGESSIYEAIEAARRGNSIFRGVLEVIRALERRRARVVVIADDATTLRLDVIKLMCAENQVPIIRVPSKRELGRFSGLEVGASCIALPVAISLE